MSIGAKKTEGDHSLTVSLCLLRNLWEMSKLFLLPQSSRYLSTLVAYADVSRVLHVSTPLIQPWDGFGSSFGDHMHS